LEPSLKKGIFVGYSESSKDYIIYVPGQQKVEINIDVTFYENIAFRKYIEDSTDSNDEEEHEGPKEETACSP
jgi:hypothetical protein